jgi:hypothetical protein
MGLVKTGEHAIVIYGGESSKGSHSHTSTHTRTHAHIHSESRIKYHTKRLLNFVFFSGLGAPSATIQHEADMIQVFEID